MKIKRKIVDENYDLVIIDDELNLGDGVTLNYYIGMYAIIIY